MPQTIAPLARALTVPPGSDRTLASDRHAISIFNGSRLWQRTVVLYGPLDDALMLGRTMLLASGMGSDGVVVVDAPAGKRIVTDLLGHART